MQAVWKHTLYSFCHWRRMDSTLLALGGILFPCETPKTFCGLENVTTASSSKLAKPQVWVNSPFRDCNVSWRVSMLQYSKKVLGLVPLSDLGLFFVLPLICLRRFPPGAPLSGTFNRKKKVFSAHFQSVPLTNALTKTWLWFPGAAEEQGSNREN